MSDDSKTDLTDTSEPHDEISDKLKRLEAITQVTRKIEEGIEFGATSGIKVYEFIKTRLSWKQRVLRWFRGD